MTVGEVYDPKEYHIGENSMVIEENLWIILYI